MVRKSLRLRIVVTFIGIVLVSLIISFFLFMQFSEKIIHQTICLLILLKI